MSTLTVSLVQMDVRKGMPRANWARMQEAVAEAARRGADVVVLPELWEAGTAYEKGREIASSLSGGLFAQVVALARQHNLFIFGSLYEKRGQGLYNTLAVVSPRSGILGAYRKMHLFSLMGEDKWMQAGEAPLALELPWGRSGFAICYDLRFPELFRRYADDGVALVFLPMAWPHPRLPHFRTLVRARAIENQCYVVAVNRAGQDEEDNVRYFGHSCIIDPWGEPVVEAGEDACHLTVTIDLERVAEVRRRLPALRDRRL